MRANAQRDGRTPEYWWRPLFNAAKFGLLRECRAVTQISAVSGPKFTIIMGTFGGDIAV